MSLHWNAPRGRGGDIPEWPPELYGAEIEYDVREGDVAASGIGAEQIDTLHNSALVTSGPDVATAQQLVRQAFEQPQQGVQ
jgi:hypothetical protein